MKSQLSGKSTVSIAPSPNAAEPICQIVCGSDTYFKFLFDLNAFAATLTTPSGKTTEVRLFFRNALAKITKFPLCVTPSAARSLIFSSTSAITPVGNVTDSSPLLLNAFGAIPVTCFPFVSFSGITRCLFTSSFATPVSDKPVIRYASNVIDLSVSCADPSFSEFTSRLRSAASAYVKSYASHFVSFGSTFNLYS